MFKQFSAVSAILLFLVAACGSGDHAPGGGVGPGSAVVGGACASNADCQQRCVGGMCTVNCTSDADCPAGSACIDDAGGTCAVVCSPNASCASFGPDWHCSNADRRGANGQVSVCKS